MISAVEAALESPQLPPPLTRPPPRVPEALPGGRRRVRRTPRRRLRAAADRAGRLPPPRASSPPAPRPPSGSSTSRGSPSWPPAGPGAGPTARPATSSATSRRSARPGQRFSRPAEPPPQGAVLLAEPEQVKGHGLRPRLPARARARGAALGRRAGRVDSRRAARGRAAAGRGRRRCASRPPRLPGGEPGAEHDRPLPSRARCAAPPAHPRRSTNRSARPSTATEEAHEEELFGPAEGLHATYRMLRDEVLEASWRAGAALSEMRLDTAEDVNRAVARYFELLKLAALIQRPGSRVGARRDRRAERADRPDRDARAARRARSLRPRRVRPRRGPRPDPAQRGAGEPGRAGARGVPAEARRRAGAVGLRRRPLPDLPAQVQVRARLRDPAGADDQPALRDPDPQRPRALPRRRDPRASMPPPPTMAA